MKEGKPRKLPSLRAAAVIAPAAILAVAVAVGPSFAGSLAKRFVTQKQAAHTYLTKETAKEKYARSTDVPLAPVARAASSTVAFGPVSTDKAYEIPQARVTFKAPVTSLVTATFSGTSTCTAAEAGVGCPLQILVDGQPGSTSDAKRTDILNFDLSTTSTSQAPATHSTTQTAVVTPGQHEVKVRYAGNAKEPSLNFELTGWNLVAVAYPDPKAEPEPES